MVPLRQVVDLRREPLLRPLLRRVDVEHVRAPQVALHERQLLLLHALAVPRLQELQEQPQAGRRVRRRRRGPHGKSLPVPVHAEARVGPVGPAPLHPHLLHHPGGEGAAQHGGGHLEGGQVLVLGVRPEGPQVHLGLGAIGFVDEDKVAPGPGLRLAGRILGPSARRQPRRQRLRQALRLLLRQIPGEHHHRVLLAEDLLVVGAGVLRGEPPDRRQVAPHAAPVAVLAEELSPQGPARQDLIVVPGLHQLRLDLPPQLPQLDLVEGRLRHQLAHQLRHRLRVPRKHRGPHGGPAKTHVRRELAAELVDGLLDLLGGHSGPSTAQHAPGGPGQPFLADRIEGRSGAEHQGHAHQGDRPALFQDDLHGATCLSPVTSSAGVAPAASSWSCPRDALTSTTDLASRSR